jgi:hypothetical protein
MLGRGTGLVYLLSNSWGGRAKLLDAAVKVGAKIFTHITLGMLTARKGLNVEQQKQAPIRVALDFVCAGSSSSSWGPQAVNVPQNAHLLLWGKPLQPILGRMSSIEVLPGYEILYGHGLGSVAITAALAKLDRSGSSSTRPRRGRQAATGSSSRSDVEGLGTTAMAAPGAGGSDLATAMAAVNILALALTPAEADAANEPAVRAVLPLLRAGASDSSRVQVVREGLKQLHAAAVKGELAEAGLRRGCRRPSGAWQR